MQPAQNFLSLPLVLLAFAGCLDNGLDVPDSGLPETPA